MYRLRRPNKLKRFEGSDPYLHAVVAEIEAHHNEKQVDKANAQATEMAARARNLCHTSNHDLKGLVWGGPSGGRSLNQMYGCPFMAQRRPTTQTFKRSDKYPPFALTFYSLSELRPALSSPSRACSNVSWWGM